MCASFRMNSEVEMYKLMFHYRNSCMISFSPHMLTLSHSSLRSPGVAGSPANKKRREIGATACEQCK